MAQTNPDDDTAYGGQQDRDEDEILSGAYNAEPSHQLGFGASSRLSPGRKLTLSGNSWLKQASVTCKVGHRAFTTGP